MVDRHDDHGLSLIKGDMAESLKKAGQALLSNQLPPLAGADRDALRSVITAVCDELVRSKEHLDQFVRSDRQHVDELTSLLPALRQIADTLAVLGFNQPRKVIIDQVSVIQGLTQGQREPNDAVLMDVAGALLYVQATLAGMIGAVEPRGDGAAREFDRPGAQEPDNSTDMAQIYRVVLIESRTCLQEALELIDECLDNGPGGEAQEHLLVVPDLLNQVRGALTMIGLARAARLLARCHEHATEHWLVPGGLAADPRVEAVASALTAIDFYLGRRVDDPQAAGDTALGVAEENLASLMQLGADPLGEWAGELESANTAPGTFDADGFDLQLLEIFRNEALTHLASLEHFLHQAGKSPGLLVSDALQRAVHTLKGSAWMAGVLPVAALATAMDRMVREFKAHRWPIMGPQVALFEATLALFKASVQRLPAEPLAPMDGSEALIGDFVQQVADGLAQAQSPAQAEHSPKREPQRISQFLEQGMDILMDADSLLDNWQAHPAQRQELSALLDELTTLGEAAHLAGLVAVDDLCEALLDLYGAVEESSVAISEVFFAAAQSAHEALLNMLDQLAAGQDVEPQPAQLVALRTLLEGGLDPSATGLVEHGSGRITDLSEVIRDLDGGAAQQQSPAELDELATMFLEEAWDIVDSANQALTRWRATPGNLAPLSAMRHDLETLDGGAQMAEVGPVSELAQGMLAVYQGLVDNGWPADDAVQGWLSAAHQTLGALLREYQAGLPFSPLEPLLQGMLAWRRQALNELMPQPQSATQGADAPQDNELLEIFLEEASDINESSSAALTRWASEPRNSLEVENLLRDLHTLKGGARMVEIAPIGDLAHELEFLYESVAAGTLHASPGLFALLQKGHDQLAQMLDAVKARRPVEQATVLIEAIRAFAAAPLAAPGPADTLQASGEAPEPAAPSLPAAIATAPVPASVSAPEPGASATERGAGDIVKVPAELLDTLGNLAGETSIVRGRIEQQVNDNQGALQEMEITLERMRDQLRRLDIETQARGLGRQAVEADPQRYADFDPLEMDRHSQLQQLSRALVESASDLLELKEILTLRTHDAQALLQHQARVNTDLQEGLMRTRMVPFGRLLPRLQRIVRQVADELGKQVEFDIGNAEGEMDRSLLERMIAPLEHMLRNAVDHGLEPTDVRLAAGKPAQGRISLNLSHQGSEVLLELSDDGAGIPLAAVRHKAIKRGLLDPSSDVSDHDILQFILQPGFSTAAKITQISGRGLGMDVVHEEVKQLGGSMTIDSSTGTGASFRIRLPLSVSVNRALMVQCGEELYAVPLNTIEGIVRVLPAELEACYQAAAPRYQYGGHTYDLRYLGDLLHGGMRPSQRGQSLALPLLLVHSHDHQVAIQVDALAGSREIVVKSLGVQLAPVQGLAGATIQGDGRVVLILDVLAQIRAYQARQASGALAAPMSAIPIRENESVRPLLVMVVDDSVTVRKVTSRLLERQGMNVLTARDGVDAMALLREHHPDILLLDIEMPRMDGFEVATQIRHDPRLKDLPIIMITSRTGAKHRDRAMAIGVNDYLGKPYQEAQLLDSIAQWSGQHA